jgi:hypothetical protein
MASDAMVNRWDKILREVESRRQCFVVPLEVLVPGYKQFDQGFHLTVDALTNHVKDAWKSDRPPEESPLNAALEPVIRATGGFDFTQPAAPQVARFMEVVAEARINLANVGPATAQEVIDDIDKLLKVTVLIARVGHQGAMQIADKEHQERNRAINKATDRAAQYLDLDTMLWVEIPSITTISLSVYLAMVDPGVPTPQERLRLAPGETNQAPILKQFAAQWVVNVYTEWEEHYRGALATALNCDKAAIRSEYFADLGRMRQDYVHNRGIAGNSIRNKLLRWYSKGEIMIPTHANYRQLLTDFPAEELLTPQPPPTANRQPITANADPELARQFEVVADQLSTTKDAALDQALAEWITAHLPGC